MQTRGTACKPAAGLVFALGAMLTPGVVGGGSLAAPSAPPAGTGALSETTEVVAVEVPVQVVREGQPVRGLSAADFEVYEGRKRQRLTGFEVLDLRERQGQAVASIPPVLRRHFLLLFDLSFSEPKSIVRAREMVRGMLPSLHPADLVAVATYSSAGGPKLALGFTSDRRQVLKAIDTLGLPELVDRNPDPLQLSAAEERSSVSGQRALAAMACGNATPRQQAEALLIDALDTAARASDSGNRQQQQAVVGAYTRSFTDLARLLASVHGRKQVIYLSEGVDTSILQGVESAEDQANISAQSIAGEGYLTDSDTRYGNTRGANVLEKMMEELRRADCVIQAVDIGGLRAPETQGPARPSGEGSLFVMAHDTGGELPVEVYAYAIDAAGAIQDFFSQSLRFELAKVIPLLDRTGLKFFGHLDLPPGDYSLRVLVRNAGNGDYGLSAEALSVPAFDGSPPVLLPPFFAENPGRWLMVREAAKDGEREVPYPFMVREAAYVPALRPALAAAQEVAVALVGYNLPAGALEPRATVLSADGRDLGRGDFKLDARQPPDAGGAERLTGTFRAPSGLEPGDYRLRIALVDTLGVAHESAARFVVAAPGPRTRG